MTTTELVHRLIKDGKSTDFSLLDAADKLDLLDALNAGVQNYYNAVPTPYKRTTISEHLPVPRELTITVTQGSVFVTGSPFLDNERSSTIVIEGEEVHNEIVANNQLLNEIVGASGSKTATIHSDAIPFTDFSIERILSDPIHLENNRRLTPDDRFATDSNYRELWYYRFGRNSFGTPFWYHIVYGGLVQNSDVIWVLKVYPIPTVAFTLQMDVELRPIRYKLTDLQTPLVLPAQDGVIESILLPICRGEFAKTKLFAGDEARRQLLITEGKAGVGAASRMQRSLKRPRRKVRSAFGF